ncbi:MAG: helix-turn-helix domain-containing protein [Hyphomonadaceae bacterium]|nr:helix-turn-helix domain-containing protein [Hyphomonadaceae bacterium]
MLSRGTSEAPRHAKVAYWNGLVAEVFSAMETKAVHPDDFEAEVRWTTLGPFGIANVTSQPAQVHRSARHIARERSQHYFLHTQIEGALTVAQDGKEAVLNEGDLVLTDSAEPYSLSYASPCSTLVLIIPPEEIRRRLPCVDDVLGVKLSGERGLSQTTSLMLRSVWQNAQNGLPPEVGARIGASLLDVFATSWIDTAGMRVAESATALARRVRIRRHIEANLRDPELTARSVAAAFGISPRYLHIIFASEGETVSNYILRRRLEECGRQLADELWRRRTITEVAFGWGFNNATHFARVFKDHYGLAPRDYRNSKVPTAGVKDKRRLKAAAKR